MPELINKQPCCGASASSGVIDVTKTPSDLVSDMKNKPVVKSIASSDDSGMSTNPIEYHIEYLMLESLLMTLETSIQVWFF